jgi:hypothetical protein
VINALPWQREKEPREKRRLEIKADDRVLLTITLVGLLVWTVQKLAVFAKGGFGLRLLAPFWGSYWREREYLADRFATGLGEGDELADFLETYALAHDSPVPLIWLTEHTHPPTELRLDRVRRAAADDDEREEIAEGPEPVKAAPAGPPAAGPGGPALTEPDPTAERSLPAAGPALPRADDNARLESDVDVDHPPSAA